MRGLWLENGVIRLRDDLDLPKPPDGEALLRVLRAGVCSTDLELVRGYYPFTGILGHEFVGVVEQGGGELAGRRVVGEINAVCGSCRECRAGRRSHCRRRTVLGIAGRNGAFAEFLTLPVENLHPVPPELAEECATFVEPLAAALEILEQVSIGEAERVLLVGDGRLGLLIAQVLRRTGCRLEVVSRRERKRQLLAGWAIPTIDTAEIEAAAYDVAVEATGRPEGFDLARRALRPRGTLVLKSTYAGSLELDASSLVVDEITVVGSRCGPFPPAIGLLANDEIEVSALIDAELPLDRAEAAFDLADQPGALKILLAP